MKFSLSRRLFCLTILTSLIPAWLYAAGPPVEVLSAKNSKVQEVIALQDAMTPGLMGLQGILGTATGLEGGQPAILVLVDQGDPMAAQIARAMPKSIRGNPIVVKMTDPIVAMKGPPGGDGPPGQNKGGGGGDSGPTVDHTAIQTPPIELGTSGGWKEDLANGYCCGGTLGSLVKDNTGTQYILSNYHVFEADIVSGGNGKTASKDDPIIQPGLIDVQCNAGNAQNVATLVLSHSLPGSNVDAAIAQIIPGMVDTSGKILEIGTISQETVGPFLGQNVKKSGRTTGLSRSQVEGLNATLSVTYENECAGGTAFTKTFTGQIILGNRGSKFLAGGDSGSLMVEDVDPNPRAVGLLFAGSKRYAVANPIDDVLSFLSVELGGEVTMVGN